MTIGNSFTVVTPNFNMGRYLARTIESVLGNLRPGDQYFVIDGGSTDDSIEIIRSYEQQLAGWVSEPDQGYADALAKGFSRAGGEYLCWVNCGDLLLDGALDKARDLLAANQSDLLYGDAIDIDEDDKVLWVSSADFQPLRSYMLYGGWTPWQVSCFWTRAIYERCGGIDRDVALAADYDLFLRMTRFGKAGYSAQAFGAHRHHAGQLSMSFRGKYKVERERIRQNEMQASGAAAGMLARLYYWVTTRVRSRYLNHFSPASEWAGKNLSEMNRVDQN